MNVKGMFEKSFFAGYSPHEILSKKAPKSTCLAEKSLNGNAVDTKIFEHFMLCSLQAAKLDFV